MKNKSRILFGLFLIILVITISIFIYLGNLPTKFTLYCIDYNNDYYKCDVVSSKAWLIDFKIMAENMCYKNSMTSIEECVVYSFGKGNCEDLKYISGGFMGSKEIIATANCRK